MCVALPWLNCGLSILASDHSVIGHVLEGEVHSDTGKGLVVDGVEGGDGDRHIKCA